MELAAVDRKVPIATLCRPLKVSFEFCYIGLSVQNSN